MASNRVKAAIGFVSFAVIAIVTYWIVGDLSPSTSRDTQSASVLNQRALDFVTYSVIQDLEFGQSGQDSATGSKLSNSALLGWIGLDQRMTAREYEAAYEGNEIAADNALKGKKILLSGTIESIDKDFTDSGFLTLRGAGLLGVHAGLDHDVMDEAATFRSGQRISLVCRGTGRVITVATLEGCQPFNDYLTRLRPEIRSKIEDFLNGKAAMPAQLAEATTSMYVAGSVMPSDSACMAGKWDHCDAEMEKRFRNPADAKVIQMKSKQMLASLKIAE